MSVYVWNAYSDRQAYALISWIGIRGLDVGEGANVRSGSSEA